MQDMLAALEKHTGPGRPFHSPPVRTVGRCKQT